MTHPWRFKGETKKCIECGEVRLATKFKSPRTRVCNTCYRRKAGKINSMRGLDHLAGLLK